MAMELLKFVKRRSFLSEAIYVGLNVVLGLALLASIAYTQSIALGLVLVFVSKWRVAAVRPRYWFANLQANLVDFIVSISFVLDLFLINNSAYTTSERWGAMIGLTVLYIAWLLFLKPRSRRVYMVAQAGVALFLGTATLYAFSYEWPVSLVVIIMWLVGYATARHVLTSYDDETSVMFLSLSWGLVLAELGWLTYHWTIAYAVPFMSGLLIPQLSVLVLALGFLIYRIYDSFYHHQKIRSQDILLPLLFMIGLFIALLVLVPLIKCGSVDCTGLINL